MSDDNIARKLAENFWSTISKADANGDNSVTYQELKDYHQKFRAEDNMDGLAGVLKELKEGKLEDGVTIVRPKMSPEHQSLHEMIPILDELQIPDSIDLAKLNKSLGTPAVEHFLGKLKSEISQGQINESRMKGAFDSITKEFDLDGDGVLSLAEMMASFTDALKRVSEEMSRPAAQLPNQAEKDGAKQLA